MAPESERAMKEKIPTDSVIECIVSQVHYLALKSIKGVVVPKTEPTDEQREHVRKILENSGWMTNPNEPTLTCSEVVERLIREAVHPPRRVNRKQAEAILHSWRERRVRELEECLRDELMQAKACVSKMRTMPTNSDIGKEAVLAAAVQRITNIERLLLANSDEWREQIRKGAK